MMMVSSLIVTKEKFTFCELIDFLFIPFVVPTLLLMNSLSNPFLGDANDLEPESETIQCSDASPANDESM